MNAFFTETLGAFVAIFVIVDPFAVVPVYLILTRRYNQRALAQTRRKASLIALVILWLFAVTGFGIFNLFGITLPAFQIAGGILLFLLGIGQLQNTRARVSAQEEQEGIEREDVSVFPLGVPLLAGPGAISTVVLMSTKAHGATGVLSLVVAIFLALVASLIVLKMAHLLYRILGQTGLNVVTRLMGLILTAIGVQFIINGIYGALRAAGKA